MAVQRPDRGRGLVGPHLEQELRATLAARRELGPEADEALVQTFLEKIEREIDRRIQDGIAARQRELARRGRSGWSLAVSGIVAVTSLGVSVPVTIALVAGGAGLAGVAVVWAVILIINLLLIRR